MNEKDEEYINNYLKLIKFCTETFQGLDGPKKMALLRTAAAHFEHLTSAEAMRSVIAETFKRF